MEDKVDKAAAMNKMKLAHNLASLSLFSSQGEGRICTRNSTSIVVTSRPKMKITKVALGLVLFYVLLIIPDGDGAGGPAGRRHVPVTHQQQTVGVRPGGRMTRQQPVVIHPDGAMRHHQPVVVHPGPVRPPPSVPHGDFRRPGPPPPAQQPVRMAAVRTRHARDEGSSEDGSFVDLQGVINQGVHDYKRGRDTMLVTAIAAGSIVQVVVAALNDAGAQLAVVGSKLSKTAEDSAADSAAQVGAAQAKVERLLHGAVVHHSAGGSRKRRDWRNN